MIFKRATTFHLGIARVLVFGILLLDLLVDELTALVSMPMEAFLPHGILNLLPAAWMEDILTYGFLSSFCLVYGLIVAVGLIGFGPAWLVTGLALLGTIFFQGLARGFGGHVNHQELIVLVSLFFFLSKRSFAAVSVNAILCKASVSEEDDEISRFLLRALSFWVLMTYFMIGVARLQTSDWRVYQTNSMTFYVVLHSAKWNYWDFSLGRNLLNQPVLEWFLRISFPVATLLEVAAPLALLVRQLVWPIVISLLLFHIAIMLTMNIFFWQNILLLFVPLLGWFSDRHWRPTTISGKPIIVFYDGTCGLCNGFIRWIAAADSQDLLRFAPLEGLTAKHWEIKLPEKRAEWTILAVENDKSYDRSDAVLEILRKTILWVDVSNLLFIVPRFFRDWVYRFVARWRHLLPFDPKFCEMPSAALRGKLLP